MYAQEEREDNDGFLAKDTTRSRIAASNHDRDTVK